MKKHSINLKDIAKWPIRKISIGDVISDRITYQLGTSHSLGSAKVKVKTSSIIEDDELDIFYILVSDPNVPEEEMLWKKLKNPSKMVEVEYDVSTGAYPKTI